MKKNLLFTCMIAFVALTANAQWTTPNEAIAGYTEEEFECDGQADEYVYSLCTEYSIDSIWQGNKPGCASFKAAWNEEYLAIYVELYDSNFIFANNPAIESNDWGPKYWESDMAEIYFDVNNNKVKNDKQIVDSGYYKFNPYLFDSIYNLNDNEFVKTRSSGSIEYALYAWDTTTQANTVQIEYLVPWESLKKDTLANVSGLSGMTMMNETIGFEIIASDRDDSGWSRTSWGGTKSINLSDADTPNKDTRYFGNLVFEGVGASLNKDNLAFGMYPNPAETSLTLENMSIGSVISVIDIAGQTVMSQVADNSKVTLNVESLNTGIYFVKSGNACQKVMVK